MSLRMSAGAESAATSAMGDGAPPARSAAGATELPSWGALAAATSRPQPRGKDSSHAGMTARITFHRDADGWCPECEQVWLGLEIKAIAFDTVLEAVPLRGGACPQPPNATTGGGSGGSGGSGGGALAVAGATASGGGGDGGGAQAEAAAPRAPMLVLPNGEEIHGDGASILRALDAALPRKAPLWPPPGVNEAVVSEMVEALPLVMPQGARPCERAAYLFADDRSVLPTPLPRAAFEATLDAAEARLAQHAGGPFLCGAKLSAADVVWAPHLERYAAQLPCLYEGLRPRGEPRRWPHLRKWYEAMDRVPAYACRVQGSAA